ncbi:ribosomal-processing cysteine protease Prp [Caldicellulosiruptoraceae bacterium PP1]
MIKAVFYKDNKGNFTKLVVQGHSGFDIEGKDIVCAAASGILLTNVNGCIEVVGIKHRLIQDKGYLLFEINETNNTKIERCNVLLETTLIGLKELMQQYPKNVYVEVN